MTKYVPYQPPEPVLYCKDEPEPPEKNSRGFYPPAEVGVYIIELREAGQDCRHSLQLIRAWRDNLPADPR